MSRSSKGSSGGTGTGNDPLTTTGQQRSSSTSAASATTSSTSQQFKLSLSQQEAIKRVEKIVQHFISQPECEPFCSPVRYKALQLYDYPTIVKRRMDLGTIQKNITNHKYPNAAHIAYDVKQVWTNCMTYNAEGSDFYLLARNYCKRFEERYRRIKNECTFQFVCLLLFFVRSFSVSRL